MESDLAVFNSLLLRWVLTLAGFYGAYVLTIGPPSGRTSKSLDFARESHIPLWAWGVALVVYGVLLITDFGDIGCITGYAVGAAIGIYFSISYAAYLASIPPDVPHNSLAEMFLIDVVAFHVACVFVTVNRKIDS